MPRNTSRPSLSGQAGPGRRPGCGQLPGQALFQYLDDDGRARQIRSTDVNRYLRDTMGEEFTAKDFPTWAATVSAAKSFVAGAKLSEALEQAAHLLGNTPAICRRAYVHPEVLAAFEDEAHGAALSAAFAEARASGGLDAEERAVLRYLGRKRS